MSIPNYICCVDFKVYLETMTVEYEWRESFKEIHTSLHMKSTTPINQMTSTVTFEFLGFVTHLI